MNKDFENLPEIAKNIDKYVFCEMDNAYKELDIRYALGRVKINGAWYAYQEQQKKKEKVLSKINQFESQSVDDKRLFLNDLIAEIKELLK